MTNKQDLTEKNEEKTIKNAKGFLVRNSRLLVIINWSFGEKKPRTNLGTGI